MIKTKIHKKPVTKRVFFSNTNNITLPAAAIQVSSPSRRIMHGSTEEVKFMVIYSSVIFLSASIKYRALKAIRISFPFKSIAMFSYMLPSSELEVMVSTFSFTSNLTRLFVSPFESIDALSRLSSNLQFFGQSVLKNSWVLSFYKLIKLSSKGGKLPSRCLFDQLWFF